MRAVFIGAGSLAIMTARQLIRRGHEVVILEQDKAVLDGLKEELDCGFLQGDGSKPAILREADPGHTDWLFCLTGSDQHNIISSLVGRSLGFPRVVTKIDDPELEHICIELGLEHVIIPSRAISRHMADLFEGHDPLEVSAMVRSDARILSFAIREEDAERIEELEVPGESRIVCAYRGYTLLLPEQGMKLRAGDEVIVITKQDKVKDLRARWMKE
jgi:trk system potassium uptake protein